MATENLAATKHRYTVPDSPGLFDFQVPTLRPLSLRPTHPDRCAGGRRTSRLRLLNSVLGDHAKASNKQLKPTEPLPQAMLYPM